MRCLQCAGSFDSMEEYDAHVSACAAMESNSIYANSNADGPLSSTRSSVSMADQEQSTNALLPADKGKAPKEKKAGTFACRKCCKEFSFNSNRLRHEKICQLRSRTVKKPSHQCNKCKKTFSKLWNKYRHEKKCGHKKILQTMCTTCHKQFLNNWNRIRHEKKCENNQRYPFKCQLCINRYSSRQELDQHQNVSGHLAAASSSQQEQTRQNKAQKDRNKLNQCSKCQKTFSNSWNKYRHEKECANRKQVQTVCAVCQKQFLNKWNRIRHEKKCENNRKLPFKCQVCSNRYRGPGELVQHQNVTGHIVAGGSGIVNTKNRTFKQSHDPSENVSQSGKRKQVSGVTCRHCQQRFDTHANLYDHRMRVHNQTGGNAASLQSIPWGEDGQPPWRNEDGSDDEKWKRAYEQHRHLILKQKRSESDTGIVYNFPVSNNMNMEQLNEQIDFIYNDNQRAFRVNLSFGIILQNIETGEYRYFVPHDNENVLDQPMLINSRDDLIRLRAKIRELDIITYAMKQRPNTRYKPVMITNVVYRIYRTSFVIGHIMFLPSYLRNCKSLISFVKNPKTGRPFEDKLCFFRCMAYHQTGSVRNEELTRTLQKQWLGFVRSESIRDKEVTLCNMPDLERCFETNINVYSRHSDKSVSVIYKSRQAIDTNKPTMNLNLYKNHCSYIKKFGSFVSKHQCKSCQKLFARKGKMQEHSKVCTKQKDNRKFSGGFYQQPRSIFDKLEELNIKVDSNLKNYPWFAVFDMEALLLKPGEAKTSSREFTNIHKPISVCLCSNVEGYETEKFILNEDLDLLLKDMIEYLNTISSKCQALSKQRWKTVFEALEHLETKWGKKPRRISTNANNDEDINYDEAMETDEFEQPSAEFLHALSKENVYFRLMKNVHETENINVTYNEWSDEDGETDKDEEEHSQDTNTEESDTDHEHNDDIEEDIAEIMRKKISNTRKAFELYTRQLVVCGFNSGKYDVNLIKSRLAGHLNLHKSQGHNFVVKKNNNYICIANENFKFLDIVNYLPPGTSYDQFLVTFDVPVRKSFFPYEYFDNIGKLKETCLPPKECFYSSLKRCNVLESKVRNQYERLTRTEQKSPKEALTILGLESEPPSLINDRYDELLQIWDEKNMKTFKDFLQYYSELDVGPMILGIKAFKSFFLNHNIDVFKDHISIPGVARKMMYDSGIQKGASFSLIDKFDDDMHETIKENLIGGASIIFCRKQKVGETFIRGDKSRVCRSILGYDANSLYLHSLCQTMPVGSYIRRLDSDGFRPQFHCKRYNAMYDWMNWINFSEQKHIKHKMNNGQEFRVGPFTVDGYDSVTNELYEFMGCWFHGCSCRERKNKKLQLKRYTKTISRLRFLRNQGYKVNVMWECEYRRKLKENEDMRKFLISNRPTFYRFNSKGVNDQQLIDGVLDESLFGMIEVDIEVPESWDQVQFKPDTTLTPYEYFEEMSPFFCSSEIPFESIGKLMQEHIEEHNLSRKPRRLLVGGMKAERLLLLSPLLKWYIQHGLLVTKIHQVVEYSKMACFTEFGRQVTDARREGDEDSTKQVFALLFKLIGNSAFGGTIMNKEKHRTIKYMKGFKKSCEAVNNPRFQSLTELENDLFEAEFTKSRIEMNTPIQLGYAILQWSKLHMLSFYYDFMVKFIDRKDFQYLEVDTDSAYFALSGLNIRDIIKENMRSKFDDNLLQHCNDRYEPAAGVNDVWFPRQCCTRHTKYDLRTPGLMKLEFEATQMISLNSKSYVASSEKSGKVKYSLKGVNKNYVDPTSNFTEVLETKSPVVAQNRGIALYKNNLYSYQQNKQAFTYLYCKRKVCENGIDTKPLDICLTPIKKAKTE